MDLRRRAAIVGFGGTIMYFVLVLVGFFIASRLHSEAGLIFAMSLGFPLLPGMIPGGLAALAIGVLGAPGFKSGFHDEGFLICSLLSAPVMNSFFAYLWLKHRASNKRP